MKRQLEKHAQDSQLSLGVMFYVADVNLLKDEMARYLSLVFYEPFDTRILERVIMVKKLSLLIRCFCFADITTSFS